MDDQGTWPTPLAAKGSGAQREFDQQVMQELRSDPQALRQIGGVRGNVLIVLVPLIAVLLLIPAWWQWNATGSGLWLAVIGVIIVVATLIWISRVKAVMRQAQRVLGTHLAGSVGYGVGVVRAVRIIDSNQADRATTAQSTQDGLPEDGTPEGHGEEATDDAENLEAALTEVEVELTLSVSPVQGKRFTATARQRYATMDALRLEVGQHGPVHYLRRNPETTTAVETRLEPEAVEKIYRAAALN